MASNMSPLSSKKIHDKNRAKKGKNRENKGGGKSGILG